MSLVAANITIPFEVAERDNGINIFGKEEDKYWMWGDQLDDNRYQAKENQKYDSRKKQH